MPREAVEGSIRDEDKRTIALRADQWEFVALWIDEHIDNKDPKTSKIRWGGCLRSAIDALKAYQPAGPGATPERDARGYFLSPTGRKRTERPRRDDQAREIARLRALLERNGIDAEEA